MPLLVVLAPVPVGLILFPDFRFVEVPSYIKDEKRRRDAYEEKYPPANIKTVERDV